MLQDPGEMYPSSAYGLPRRKRYLFPTQFGFLSKRNTETATTLFMDTIRENMDKGPIFIDLSKAFGTFGHGQIIQSLESYGFTGAEKELFSDYLFGRKQSVRIGNETSQPEPIVCGVPQGAIFYCY